MDYCNVHPEPGEWLWITCLRVFKIRPPIACEIYAIDRVCSVLLFVDGMMFATVPYQRNRGIGKIKPEGVTLPDYNVDRIL